MDKRKIGRSIEMVREKAGFTRNELAEKLSVAPELIAVWESGENLPNLEQTMMISEITNTPYSVLVASDDYQRKAGFSIRGRLFHEDNMYTRMKSYAQAEHLHETFRALTYMRERHVGQFRKPGRHSSERILYINHPLLMACQAHAFGIKDDALLAAVLLHDVVEDTGVSAEELPFGKEVQDLVDLVSFSIPEGMTREEAKKIYYERIHKNPKACIIKILDRCNNISTMAASFGQERMIQYIAETEEYILPLCTELKINYPEYSNVAFLIKYHMRSVLETIKNLLIE